MAATLKFDALATVGEYTDRNGETKKRYQRVGGVFENDKGQLSLRIEALPISKDWNGWVSFYEPKPRDGQNTQTSKPAPARKAAPPPTPGASDGFGDDDIPFAPLHHRRALRWA